MARFLYPVLLLILVLGCSGPRAVSYRTPKDLDSGSILEFLKNNSVKESMKIRGRIDIESETEQYSALTTIQIIPDSLFWMNATKLGFEVFRTLITRDSVIYVDRFNREYLQSSIRDIQDYFGVPLNFAMLQSLIFGHMLEIESKQRIEIAAMDENQIHIQSNGGIDEDYWYSRNSFTLSSLRFHHHSGQSVNSKLTEWQVLEGRKKQLFAFGREFQLPLDGEIYQAKLEINKVERIEADGIGFKIPSHYTRVSF